MSIINEALKKAEQEKNKMITDEPGYTDIASKAYKTKVEEMPKPFPLPESLPPAVKKRNYIMWVFIAILFSMAVMSIFIIATKPKGKIIVPIATAPTLPQPRLPSQADSNTSTLPVAGQPIDAARLVAPEPPAIKMPSTPPALILSGIVAGGDDSFAIIDGRIVKKGAVISGSKVKEIYSDKVVLEFEGAEFSLRSP